MSRYFGQRFPGRSARPLSVRANPGIIPHFAIWPGKALAMNADNLFDRDLSKNSANHVALSPLSFLSWAAEVYPDRPALVYGEWVATWRATYARCRRLASALTVRGVTSGDTVAVMAPNIPAMFEAHFGVPMAGAVLNALNTRLDADAIAFMLRHGEAKVLIADREYFPVVSRALESLERKRW